MRSAKAKLIWILDRIAPQQNGASTESPATSHFERLYGWITRSRLFGFVLNLVMWPLMLIDFAIFNWIIAPWSDWQLERERRATSHIPRPRTPEAL